LLSLAWRIAVAAFFPGEPHRVIMRDRYQASGVRHQKRAQFRLAFPVAALTANSPLPR